MSVTKRSLLTFLCVALAVAASALGASADDESLVVSEPLVQGATLEIDGEPTGAVVDHFQFTVDFGADSIDETSFSAQPTSVSDDGKTYFSSFVGKGIVFLREGPNIVRVHAVSTENKTGPERTLVVIYAPPPPPEPTPTPTPIPEPPSPPAFKIKGLKTKSLHGVR